jgi:hypothetical protein
MPDSERQPRAPRIMRLPQPHDPDGRPCLPTHHPRSQPPWPISPTPTGRAFGTPMPPTCWPTSPPSLTRELPAAAATSWSPSWGWPPPRYWAARAVDRRDRRMGRRCAPAGPGRTRRPPRRPRPLRRPRRGHHPPHPGPPGRRRPGRRGRSLAGRPGPGASQTGSQPRAGRRCRRQDAARRPPTRR